MHQVSLTQSLNHPFSFMRSLSSNFIVSHQVVCFNHCICCFLMIVYTELWSVSVLWLKSVLKWKIQACMWCFPITVISSCAVICWTYLREPVSSLLLSLMMAVFNMRHFLMSSCDNSGMSPHSICLCSLCWCFNQSHPCSCSSLLEIVVFVNKSRDTTN